jgi:hypothetical protein
MNIDDRLPSPERMRKRMYWTMGFIVAGLGITYLVTDPKTEKSPGTEFQDFVAKLRAAGEPTTPNELYGPPPSAEDNAAPEIAAALRWLDETVGREDKWTVTGPWDRKYDEDSGPWFETAPAEEIRDLQAFLVRLRPFYDRVAAAAERPRCRFPSSVDGRGMIQDAGVPALQTVTRVLAARAFVDPDPAARVEACRTLCVLAGRFEPSQSVGEAMKAAMSGVALTALRHGVESRAVDPSPARGCLDESLAPTWLDLHARFCAAELVQQISEFSAILDGRNPPSPGHDIAPTASATLARWCEVVHEAAKWPTRPYTAYLRRARASVENARAKHEMAMVLLPAFAERVGRTEAASRLARVALVVAEHRVKHGDFPASLDELKAAFPDGAPLDPFTDAPFAYERTPSRARIASAGRPTGDKPLDDATLRERCLVWELKR